MPYNKPPYRINVCWFCLQRKCSDCLHNSGFEELLNIFVADIQNTYLTTPYGEKLVITCEPVLGSENIDKTTVIIRALYGLRISGTSLCNCLAKFMTILN